jgi:hypothetical protein
MSITFSREGHWRLNEHEVFRFHKGRPATAIFLPAALTLSYVQWQKIR